MKPIVWFRSLFTPKCPTCRAPMDRSKYGFRYECVQAHPPGTASITASHDRERAVTYFALGMSVALFVLIVCVLWYGTRDDGAPSVDAVTAGESAPSSHQ